MTYLKVGDGVWVNGEREIDYDVLPSGYVDVLSRPAWIGRINPSTTSLTTCGPEPNPGDWKRQAEQACRWLSEHESATDLVNWVAGEQREGKR